MEKKLQRIFCSAIVLILLLVFPKVALSYHQKQVLGEEDAVVVQMPQTAEGPGFILPDSPLFFLDKIKQNFRLLAAFTPEEKARVYSLIAGERFAESRAMLAKNNETEAENSLKRMDEEFNKASLRLEEARLEGRDVSVVAREINNNIKEKYNVLDELSVNSETPFELRLVAVNESILQAKVRVEDALPKHEVEHELEEHLKRKIEHRVHKASKEVEELEEELMMLDREASEAAKKSIHKEEKAIRKAAKERDELVRKEAQKRLERERKRLEKLLRAKEKAAEHAQEALDKFHEAAEAYREAHELINRIENGEELEEEDEEEIEDDIDEIEDIEEIESPL